MRDQIKIYETNYEIDHIQANTLTFNKKTPKTLDVIHENLITLLEALGLSTPNEGEGKEYVITWIHRTTE